MIRTSLRTAEPGVGAAAPAGSGREPGPGPEPVRGRLPRGHSALPPGRRQSARYARLASDSRITVAELLPAVSPIAATSTSATLTCITDGRSGPINSIEPSRCRPRRVDRAAWPPRHDVTYCDSSSSRLARADPPLRSPVRSAWLSAMAAPEGSIWPAAFPASRGRARFKWGGTGTLCCRSRRVAAGGQGASARAASRSSDARSLSAVVARARRSRFWSVS